MSNRFSLEGKTVVLTGAGGFFGRYFTKAFLDEGAKVILIDISMEGMESFLKEYGNRYQLFFVDLYDRKEAQECYDQIIFANKVNVLVNNAFDFGKKTGFNTQDGKLGNATYEQLLASFESGAYWAIQATQTVGIAMKKHGSGSIINISSMYAISVPPPNLYEGTDRFNPPGYSMAKAGLLQFTKYAASFLSPEVRVNAISPGIIPNLENPKTSIREDDPVMQKFKKQILLKRLGNPRD